MGTKGLAISAVATPRTPPEAASGAATETLVAQSKGPHATAATARPTAMTSPGSKSGGR